MKRKFSICMVLMLLLTLLVPTTVFASSLSEEEDTTHTTSFPYEITHYSVHIDVNEDNSMDITEKISVNFNEPRHGIFRKLPIRNKITRLDGTKSRNHAKISNVSVDQNFSTSTDDGYYVIKIGSAATTLTGPQEYTIKYRYDIGRDPSKDYDELYYNLIGSEWDTSIDFVEFSINMPKEFEEEYLGFSVGYFGSTASEDVRYTVNGTTIEGYYLNGLDPYEGITVRLQLPEGYFTTDSSFTLIRMLMLIIPAICLFISFFLWLKYGKDDRPIETVEFYPPEGFNSLEVGFLYKGRAEKEDVVSLLVYLAGKGYLSLSEIEEKAIFGSKKTFQITKLKDYDGNNEYERIFLTELFSTKTTVTEADLNLKFYRTVDRILAKINTHKNKVMINHSVILQQFFVVLGILSSLMVTVTIPTLEIASIGEVFVSLMIMLFYVPFYAVLLIKGIPTVFRIFWGGFTFLHSLAFFSSLPILEAMLLDPFYFVSVLFGMGCIAGMIVFCKLMPKRTPYGTQILGRVLGFKRFLLTAEKNRLEALVMDNPTYFYDILPYTYVLGVSNKWIAKFESIAIEEPDWYHSPSGFHAHTFGTFMHQTMTSANRAMTSQPSSSGGSSGGSGGGCSGGGSGGGGGGSW